MRVVKLRIADDNGLVPAGRYFDRLAADLRDANARETARRERSDAQTRTLQHHQRRSPAARAVACAQSADFPA